MVDIIIPVYKPGAEFIRLLKLLCTQSIKPNRIILMNTVDDDKYDIEDERLCSMISDAGATEITEVHNVKKSEFNHGLTRKAATQFSDAEYFICMTQDAIPYDDSLIEKLVTPLDDAAMSYARQLARDDADDVERITREFNYPDESRVKTKADLATLGIKTFFASNVCAAYKRSVYDELGGFIPTDFNEDMIYARKLIDNGYAIKYCADAKVIHSHNLSGLEQFNRNREIAKSQKLHPEIFGDVKSESEGVKLVKTTAARLCKEGKWYKLPKLVWQSGWKYLGYKL